MEEIPTIQVNKGPEIRQFSDRRQQLGYLAISGPVSKHTAVAVDSCFSNRRKGVTREDF